ncbi:hypothetical protein SCAR479_02759 [Seiridium cardinale]|uniref:Uncharacterized protein n=1 Tax=Seiridium cardinale TaxID=138064 RepID=A0ABR2Y205_9PEZI
MILLANCDIQLPDRSLFWSESSQVMSQIIQGPGQEGNWHMCSKRPFDRDTFSQRHFSPEAWMGIYASPFRSTSRATRLWHSLHSHLDRLGSPALGIWWDLGNDVDKSINKYALEPHPDKSDSVIYYRCLLCKSDLFNGLDRRFRIPTSPVKKGFMKPSSIVAHLYTEHTEMNRTYKAWLLGKELRLCHTLRSKFTEAMQDGGYDIAVPGGPLVHWDLLDGE